MKKTYIEICKENQKALYKLADFAFRKKISPQSIEYSKLSKLASFKFDQSILKDTFDGQWSSNCTFIYRVTDIDCNLLPETPLHWASADDISMNNENLYRIEFIFSAICHLFGTPFGWATQQDGRIIHDILPIKAHESEQLGSGSRVLLTLHTEDAFHPHRADYIALGCLRNPCSRGTLVASVEDLDLTAEEEKILSKRIFKILPDESHTEEKRSSEIDTSTAKAYESIENLRQQNLISILTVSGSLKRLRLDPYFMPLDNLHPSEKCAFEAICTQLYEKCEEITLQPGELAILDNSKVVHGRKAYKAKYDGYDRWLKRFNLSRDIFKTIENKIEHDIRVVS